DLCGERVVEKFVVGAPPEWIVHNRCSGERRILKPRTIKRNILRNTIYHHVVSARFALNYFVDPDKLGDDVLAAGFLIHPLHKCRWKTVLLAKKDSDFFHQS